LGYDRGQVRTNTLTPKTVNNREKERKKGFIQRTTVTGKKSRTKRYIYTNKGKRRSKILYASGRKKV